MGGIAISEAAIRDAVGRGLCCAIAARELGHDPCNLYRAAQRLGIRFPRRLGERDAQIVDAVLRGATQKDVAARFGISRGRVSQIMMAHREATNGRFS